MEYSNQKDVLIPTKFLTQSRLTVTVPEGGGHGILAFSLEPLFFKSFEITLTDYWPFNGPEGAGNTMKMQPYAELFLPGKDEERPLRPNNRMFVPEEDADPVEGRNRSLVVPITESGLYRLFVFDGTNQGGLVKVKILLGLARAVSL